MGSATPSIESSFNLMKDKFEGVQLNERFGNIELPEIVTIDLKLSYKKKEMNGAFSNTLIDTIETTLSNDKQVILFQNQRGYAPVMECLDCGHTPQCSQCDVTLTYHQPSKQLKCHYCGFSIAAPIQCHACGSVHLQTKGVGTQQIQEQVESFFPKVKTARMDWDTTRGKWAFDKLINAFVDGDIKILVGTQMVVKGLDFENVHLVGVLNADHLLNFPDFRAHERTYQMLSQVSGRAGRKNTRGKVLIQTYQPEHPIIQQVINSDYEKMLEQQLKERLEYHYPPFYRLTRIVIKHRDVETVRIASKWIFNVLDQSYNGEILGPVFPPIARLRNQYHMQILIKIGRQQSRNELKQLIKSTIKSFESVGKFRSCKVAVNVDPY
jgi:primosomal protein N' (replication factor Y)